MHANLGVDLSHGVIQVELPDLLPMAPLVGPPAQGQDIAATLEPSQHGHGIHGGLVLLFVTAALVGPSGIVGIVTVHGLGFWEAANRLLPQGIMKLYFHARW